MQYESAKSELQSPPPSISLSGMLFEAVTMLVITSVLFWLV
jgi:hypothetical protein